MQKVAKKIGTFWWNRRLLVAVLSVATIFVVGAIVFLRIGTDRPQPVLDPDLALFRDHQRVFSDAIDSSNWLDDGEVRTRQTLPPELLDLGVVSIRREGEFVFFEMAPIERMGSVVFREYVYCANTKPRPEVRLAEHVRDRGGTIRIDVIVVPWCFWQHRLLRS
jgi:hypothetical protein